MKSFKVNLKPSLFYGFLRVPSMIIRKYSGFKFGSRKKKKKKENLAEFFIRFLLEGGIQPKSIRRYATP